MNHKLLRRRRYTALFLCANALVASAVYADVILGLDTGNAKLSDSRYGSATTARLTGGYRFGPISVVASTYEFEEFVLNNNRNAELELDGTSVEAFWTVEAGPLNVNLGGGLFDWESKTKLDGRTFGRDSGTSGMLEAGTRVTFGSLVGIYLNARWIEDLSGEDLTTLSGGVQFSF